MKKAKRLEFVSKEKRSLKQVVASQSDLAELAGVSLATIHNYFNRPQMVRESTRQKIQKLIKDVDYHPNQMARAMVKGRTYAIGVIVPRLEVAYYAKLFSSIERAANTEGYRCFACQHLDDPKKEVAEISALRSWRVDGMIIRGCGRDTDGSVFEKLMKARVPFVQVDSLIEGIEKYCVLGDDRRDSCTLVSQLVAKGHRRIAYIGFDRSGDFRRSARYMGYVDALEGNGIALDPLLTEGLRSEYDGGRAEARRLLQGKKDRRPTAVFAFNDHAALSVLHGVADLNLRAPVDVEVAGFGGYLDSTALPASVSTTIQNTDEMGRQAFEMLQDQIVNGRKPVGPVYVSGTLSFEKNGVFEPSGRSNPAVRRQRDKVKLKAAA